MLKTFTIPGTDTVMPGQEEVDELVSTGLHNDFCKDMVLRSLIRVWHVANSREQLAPHRRLYGRAIKAIGGDCPELAAYYSPLSQEDIEANFGGEEA
jgi:hypothetical protein